MSAIVLSLNAGSSTLKYAIYACDRNGERELTKATLPTHGHASAATLRDVLARIAEQKPGAIAMVGHRLVHGGSEFALPVRVDSFMLGRLRGLASLAPLHLPPALDLLEAALSELPRALHVACFDTAFHRDLPAVAQRLPLPDDLHRSGVRRYGFHGLSYEYVVSMLGTPPPSRVIVAHLGSGVSLAAVRDGRSIDTTMGYTPTGGVPMGTRSGDLDPGVIVYLQRERRYSVEAIEHLVNHESGLLGVSGSADMAELLEREAAGQERARNAVELFAYALKKQIGAYVAALGGLDCLVFTGGIGEHTPRVRELACSGLKALGIELDAARNAENADVISRPGAQVQVRVIATNEDLVICRAALAVARLLPPTQMSSNDAD